MTIDIRKPGQMESAAAHAPERWVRARQYVVARRVAVVAVTRKHAWQVWQVGKQLPLTALFMIGWAPRGFCRVAALVYRYAVDADSAVLRAQHASAKESDHFTKVSAVRSATLAARARTIATIAGLLLALGLLWWAPDVLQWIAALLTFAVALKVLPLRDWYEVIVAGVGGVLAYVGVGIAAPLVPRPPEWLLIVGAVGIVAGLGYAGRPIARPLIKGMNVHHGAAPPLTAPVVMAALVALGIKGMKDPAGITLLMDVARHGQGYQIDLELPGAVTATDVIEKREELAAALRRELSTVWPSVGPRHPGHLLLYISHVPMASARQARWALLSGGPVNLFQPLPLFTNQRGEWVMVTLAYTAWVIGAVPRMGKTVALRILGLVAALDPRAKLFVFDLKGTGDLSALAKICESSGGGYGIGDEPEELAEQLTHMRRVREEMRRRTRLIRAMTLEENPDRGKVTDALASKNPADFGPIVVLVDECQIWFEECDDKEMKEEFTKICRDLVKRGPALGIIPIYATQKPDAKSIPAAISANASARLCLKVTGQISNDQVLGTSQYQAGIRATQFGFSEKGVAYFLGDGAEPIIVRTVFGVDATVADELADKALALRVAAGLVVDGGVIDVEFVPELDVPGDCLRMLVDRGRDRAHLAELAEWLAGVRPEYAALDAAALGKRLRADGVRVHPQVKVGQVNSSGVRLSDLRKHLDEDDAESVGEAE